MKLTLTQLENLNDAIYILYMCHRVENRTEPREKLQSFLKADDKTMSIAYFFFVMSKILNKHPQKLYPKFV